jgi:hypothetical protein
MSEFDGLSHGAGKKLDRLLEQSFPPGQPLSAEFESRVISSIQRQGEPAKNDRKIFIAMMIYWALASFTGAWLLSGALPAGLAESNSYAKTVLPVLALIAASLFFLLRQSNLKLSDLFLKTIQ